MPSKDTQVYWHELPTPQSPWRNVEVLKTYLMESKRVTALMAQQQWRSGGVAAQIPRIVTHRTLPSPTGMCRADRLRDRATRHIERPLVFRRVVPEPHATPLQVVNLIMEHLKMPPVLVREAAEVVERVTQHFITLTQPSQSHPMGESEVAVSPSRRSRRRPGASGAASATESVLSQVTRQDGNPQGPAYSQASIDAGGGTVGSLSLFLQDSLLLDTVSEFCAARGLIFRRLSKKDLRTMRYRVSSLETLPHRRVVLLADRHDPVFAVLFGVSRRVTPEPFVVSALQMSGKTPDSIPRYRKAEAPLTQLFCMAPAPVPWRRVTTNISVSTLRDEFAVAVIELGEAEEEGKAGEDNKKNSPHCSGAKRDYTAHDDAGAPPNKVQRKEDVDLLGEDTDESVGIQSPILQGADGVDDEAETVLSCGVAANAPTLSTAESVPLERRWLESNPLFPNPAQLARRAASDAPVELSDPTSGACDPLLNLPRLEGAARRRGSFHREWYRRLLPKASSDFMSRMCASYPDD